MEYLSLQELRNVLELRQKASESEARAVIEPHFPHSPVNGNQEGSLKGFGNFPEPTPDEPGVPNPHLSSANLIANVTSVEIVDEIRSRQKSIYGEDDRVEVIDSPIAVRRMLAASVAAIVPRSRLITAGENRVSIGATTLAERYAAVGKPLCSREIFREQPSSAVGTAFLVTPNIVATAHHCLSEDTAAQHCLVFDFQVGDEGTAPTHFDVEDIYAVKRFVDGNQVVNGEDWALVELDRPVENRDPLVLRTQGAPEKDTPLFVIGHPAGLPKKVAGNAEIRDNSSSSHFVANLDTFGGNSGSPVFNALTNEVEAILVRGAADFVPMGDCYSSLICPITGCQGEDCSRISAVVGSLNGSTFI